MISPQSEVKSEAKHAGHIPVRRSPPTLNCGESPSWPDPPTTMHASTNTCLLPDEQRRPTPYSPVTILIALVATLGILLYAQRFCSTQRNRGDFLPYALVITAETILITHALLAMWTILSGAKSPRDFAFYESQNAMFDKKAIKAAGLKELPHVWPIMLRGKEITVDVFITVYGEELSKIHATAAAAIAIKGKHRTWILDDGRSDGGAGAGRGTRLPLRAPAQQQRRQGRQHQPRIVDRQRRLLLRLRRGLRAAAGLPCRNRAVLREQQCRLRPNAPDLRQSDQHGVPAARAAMQASLLQVHPTGRNHFNAAFCVGTNVIFRRSAINDVGGIYTDSKSEDVWTSLMLHERGWKTIYIPKTLAIGDAPGNH